ncbi:MAG TPA: metal-dependent hydrolase [Terracidiphilus sp.]|nr:metal-dependent hydrolase [Terracidiphilus sp.]
MEPITHFLTGACIGRAGFNRKTAYATLAAVLAAEAADLDILWGFAGPVEELKHHRGITHTFIAAPVVAGVIVGAVWLLSRWARANKDRRKPAAQEPSHPMRRKTDHREPDTPPPEPAPASRAVQPVRWGWLYLTALVAALSHLMLDWTNNYGVRPFFPFNPRWYAGSFVFIAEPVLWALLLLALFVPWVLGLADREMGAKKTPFRGRGWAIFALAGMVALWAWRWYEHAQGMALVENAQVASEPVTRLALEPYMVNPYHWHAILETNDFYQTAEVNTWTGEIESDPEKDVMYKPADTPAVEAAKQTFLGRVYLDWGSWAVVRDLGPEPVKGMAPPDLPPDRHWTTVEFSDLRFDYRFLPSQDPAAGSPLSGWVYIVDGRDDAGEAMAGREQR